MVMSFKMKKLLIYEKEDDMEAGGPITIYDFRYVYSGPEPATSSAGLIGLVGVSNIAVHVTA